MFSQPSRAPYWKYKQAFTGVVSESEWAMCLTEDFVVSQTDHGEDFLANFEWVWIWGVRKVSSSRFLLSLVAVALNFPLMSLLCLHPRNLLLSEIIRIEGKWAHESQGEKKRRAISSKGNSRGCWKSSRKRRLLWTWGGGKSKEITPCLTVFPKISFA